ncbi:MAG: hypothetical protein ACOCUS_06330 [Polyangiales bacterium]
MGGSFDVLRRRYFDGPLGRYGFRPYRATMLARLVDDWVLQLVVLRPNKWGDEFGVVCAVRPLFAGPNETLVLQPGAGLGDFLEAAGEPRNDWWARKEPDVRDASQRLHEHALPWLDANRDASGILAARERRPEAWWNEAGLAPTLGHVLLRARRGSEALRVFGSAPTRIPQYAELRNLVQRRAWERIDALQWRYVALSVRNLGLQPLARAAA